MYDHLQHLLPQTSNWFSSNLEYKGEGIAVFSNPKGYIKGETICKCDQTGHCSVEMTVEDWKNEEARDEEDDKIKFVWLVNGFKPQNSLGDGILVVPGNKNVCESLGIRTHDGGSYKASFPYFDNRETPFTYTARFTPLSAEFRGPSENKDNSKYWEVPFLNYIGTYYFNALMHSIQLREHPLL